MNLWWLEEQRATPFEVEPEQEPQPELEQQESC